MAGAESITGSADDRSMKLERELKMELAGGIDLASLGGEPLDAHEFDSTYFDTEDLRLLRAGLTLRRRVEHGLGRWQLKIPSNGGRAELEAVGGPAGPPESIAAPIRGIVRSASVTPIATLRTRRRGRSIEGVEVTIDEVDVLEGQAVVGHFVELEAELVRGDVRALDRIGGRLRRLGAKPGGGRPKLERVVRLPDDEPRATGDEEVLRAYLEAQYREILRADPVIRMGDEADTVHDMRVAVRRLRSVLRTARPMLMKDEVRRLRDELEWLGERLGDVRDLDVLSARLQRESESLGLDRGRAGTLLGPLEDKHDEMRGVLLAALESDRYLTLLDAVEATAAAPRLRKHASLEALAAKDFRRVQKRSRGLKALDDKGLHEARIAAKRARYAAELAEPLRGKPARRFADKAEQFQDILGEHQDSVVAIEQLRHLATLAEKKGAALAAGRLIERQETRKRDARRQAPAVWTKLRRRGKRTW
jgi:CHAD domain-containing protein